MFRTLRHMCVRHPGRSEKVPATHVHMTVQDVPAPESPHPAHPRTARSPAPREAAPLTTRDGGPPGRRLAEGGRAGKPPAPHPAPAGHPPHPAPPPTTRRGNQSSGAIGW